jgi:hypothetical protein
MSGLDLCLLRKVLSRREPSLFSLTMDVKTRDAICFFAIFRYIFLDLDGKPDIDFFTDFVRICSIFAADGFMGICHL